MKNFFETNNSDGKISDKAFKQSLVISVLCILFCMIGLCSITYAWFTKETKSQTNSITSGNFELEVKDCHSLRRTLEEGFELR